MTALLPAGPLLRAEEKKEVRPRVWAADVLKKIRPAVVIVEERRQDADGKEVQPRCWLGVLIDPKGTVVMPRRTFAGADRIGVVLSDGRKLIPRKVVSDAEADLAVLQVEDDRPFPHAAFGDSQCLQVGDWVLSLDCTRSEVSFELGLFTGKARAGQKGAGRLHMDSARSYPSDRDLLLNRQGEIIGIWTKVGAVPGERVKESVRRLLR
jgi:S1-C subfamily serine protease